MNVRTLIRNPLIAAVLGAAAVGAPVGVLYGSLGLASGPAVAAPAPRAPVTPVPEAANSGAMLPDFSSMVEKYGAAVVNIQVIEKEPTAMEGDQGDGGFDPFGPDSPFAPFFRGIPFQQPEPVRGEGSGFIIRSDGLILTNAHVVNGASEVTVRLTDRREYRAKVIGIDKTADIAVIKINAKNLPTVKLGDSRTLKVGQWVLAIGAPFGFANSATAGIVSAKGRVLGSDDYVPFIQTDVPINPGNSGGPLFNMRGEVVGINSQIYSRTGGYMGVSFSIPIDVALQVAHQLETTGHVSRGQLGVSIEEVSQGLADSFGLPEPEGALVASVQPDGAAARAGIREGDVILKLNGKPVEDSDQLPVEIRSLQPGTVVDLTVWRNHSMHNIEVKLGSFDENLTASNTPQPQHGGRLGLAVRPLTPDERSEAHVKGGLVVEQVMGPALDAGVQQGDIVLAANGTPVSTVEQLRRVIDRSKGHVALLVQRNGVREFIPVQVG